MDKLVLMFNGYTCRVILGRMPGKISGKRSLLLLIKYAPNCAKVRKSPYGCNHGPMPAILNVMPVFTPDTTSSFRDKRTIIKIKAVFILEVYFSLYKIVNRMFYNKCILKHLM